MAIKYILLAIIAAGAAWGASTTLESTPEAGAPVEAMRSAALAEETRELTGMPPGVFLPEEAVAMGQGVIEAIEITAKGELAIRARDGAGVPTEFTVQAYEIGEDGVFLRAVSEAGDVVLVDCDWTEAKAMRATLLVDGEATEGVAFTYQPSI